MRQPSQPVQTSSSEALPSGTRLQDSDRVNDAFEILMSRYEAQVFTAFDRRTCSPQALRDFQAMLRKRLLNREDLPTVDEVDGIKLLVLDFFHYHPDRPPSPFGAGQF